MYLQFIIDKPEEKLKVGGELIGVLDKKTIQNDIEDLSLEEE
jgi:hypothetical protein